MSTIKAAVEKLQLIIDTPDHDSYGVWEMKDDIQKVISLLTAKDVLFLEWNAIDIQQQAREKLSFMENCEASEIIDNPLSQKDVEEVIDLLEDRYDCNYGITWETINCVLDELSLPDRDQAMKRLKVSLTMRNDYLMNIISPIVSQMISAGRSEEAVKMMHEITSLDRYTDALEIVNRYVIIEYVDKEN